MKYLYSTIENTKKLIVSVPVKHGDVKFQTMERYAKKGALAFISHKKNLEFHGLFEENTKNVDGQLYYNYLFKVV